MGRKVKRGRVKKKEKEGISEENAKVSMPKESLEQLTHQRDEIQALLSSLEDAYTEATILEEDYNDIKSRNARKLEEINKKIEFLKKKEERVPKAEPKEEAPLAEPEVAPPEAPAVTPPPAVPVVVEEEVKKKPKKKLVGPDDLKKLEVDLAERVKEMVEEIGTKITEKDLLEIKNKFAKFDTEIEKLKAIIETVREGRRISDEKVQRAVEGLAEIRTMVYGREASMKEEEVRLEKVMDIMNRVEPEKIVMELGKRDEEMNDQKLKIKKLEETTGEFGEMLKRIEKLLRDIGSLENVVKISNEASEKLMGMQNIERNNQKMLDKIQGIYAELSKRMEEFMLYRAKQDRMSDLLSEVTKNIDDINTKAAYFVTKDDLESLRTSIQAAAPAAPAAPAPSAEEEIDKLKTEKSEIEMLMKSMEEEYKRRVISKEDYEKMREANLAKIEDIDRKIKGGETVKEAKPPETVEKAVVEKPPEKKPEEKPVEKKEEKKPPEIVERDEMLLKDLEETFKKGFISKEAYEKTKKMILGKGE